MPFTDAQKTEIQEFKQFFEAYFGVVSKKSSLLSSLMSSGSNDIVIAGGAFAVMLRNCAIIDKYPRVALKSIPEEFEKLNDIDVFFLNATNNGRGRWPQYFAAYNDQKLVTHKSHVTGYIKNPHVLDIYEENVVVSPDDGKTIKVQYILTDYNTREKLIAGFDFKHCTMNYYDKKLYVTEAAYDAAKNKKLIVNNDNIAALWRIDKFKKSGYTEPKDAMYNEYTQAIKQSIKQTFGEIVQEVVVSKKAFDWANPLEKLLE